MRRREFLTGLLLTATAASARAQQNAKVYRLAIVDPINPVTDLTDAGELPYYRGFFERLRQLGFVEGGNLEIKRYSGEGHSERFGDMVKDRMDMCRSVALARRPERLLTARRMWGGGS